MLIQQLFHRRKDLISGNIQHTALDAALASLPAVARTVVWLHDVEGFTHKEIAQLMGRSESFSKSQLSRAYQRLRPLLAARVDAGSEASAAVRSY